MLEETAVCLVGEATSCDRPNVRQVLRNSDSALFLHIVDDRSDHVIEGKLKSPLTCGFENTI